jgi:hypothetical protein
LIATCTTSVTVLRCFRCCLGHVTTTARLFVASAVLLQCSGVFFDTALRALHVSPVGLPLRTDG